MKITKLLTTKNIPFKQINEDAKVFKVVFDNQLAYERGKHALRNNGYKITKEMKGVQGYEVAGDCAAFDVHQTDPARLKSEVKEDLKLTKE